MLNKSQIIDTYVVCVRWYAVYVISCFQRKFALLSDAKLTDFIINIFSLLFNIQFKFIPWDFIPNNSIEYIHSSKIVRRYKDCVNLNATIYSIFEEFIHANDKCFHRFSKIYPVDNLYKYDVEADYNDFPF